MMSLNQKIVATFALLFLNAVFFVFLGILVVIPLVFTIAMLAKIWGT